MGGKASNLFADVIMNYIVTMLWKSLLYNTNLLCFTDTLMIASAFSMTKKSVIAFEKILYSTHPNIAFTTELQSKNRLSFLDVLVDNSGSNLVTSTFRKPTHTELYTK